MSEKIRNEERSMVEIEHIDPADPAFAPWRENFIKVSGECRCSNMEGAYNRDIELQGAYVGRELLEMMQNADDQNSSVLEFTLDHTNRILTIVNSGKETKPFSKKGFVCLIRANTSEKRIQGNSAIGHKGCGFRSLLNWAEEIRIHSNHVVFTFSEEARNAAWNEICGKTDADFENAKEKLLQQYQGNVIPLSLMATPTCSAEQTDDGPSWTEEDGWITRISLKFKSGELSKIEKQLNEITPESLLFVRHLTDVRIKEITADGCKEKTLTCKKSNSLPAANPVGFQISDFLLNDGEKEVRWKKGVQYAGENEIAVAWRADRRPIESGKRVAYTFFRQRFSSHGCHAFFTPRLVWILPVTASTKRRKILR